MNPYLSKLRSLNFAKVTSRAADKTDTTALPVGFVGFVSAQGRRILKNDARACTGPEARQHCADISHPPTDISASRPSPLHVQPWEEAREERAAIIEYDGGAPKVWAEALAPLDPNKPPGDVPPRRWLRFIDDCGQFLDSRWAARAATLGWGPLDLFGCDRERPFVRVDHLGLLWLLYGGTIIELHRDRAIIERDSGARQTYRRRPVEIGRVALAWELSS